MAAFRAAETARPDPLFSDPFAALFVAAAGWSPHGRDHSASLAAWISVRTRFLDEFAVSAVRRGCDQVVILGAGLDARALRLDWPARVRVFEVDTRDVLDFKERVLLSHPSEPRCERVVVPADLRGAWTEALESAGWQADVPTTWIAEGLLVYLTDAENDRIIGTLSSRSVAGSCLGLTLTNRRWSELTPSGADRRGYRALWRSAARADPTSWLRGHGWDSDLIDAREQASAYRRAFPGDRPRGPSGWLVSAQRE